MERANERKYEGDIIVALVGAADVGKTSIFGRFERDLFGIIKYLIWTTDRKYEDRNYYIVDLDGLNGTVSRVVYSYSNIICLVFAGNDDASFTALDKFYSDAKQQAAPNTQFLVVGTKFDLINTLEAVEKLEKRAEDWALEKEAFYINFSPKNHSIKSLFSKLKEITDKAYVDSIEIASQIRPSLRSLLEGCLKLVGCPQIPVYRHDTFVLGDKDPQICTHDDIVGFLNRDHGELIRCLLDSLAKPVHLAVFS